MTKKYLFFVQQPYSFAILRPLQTQIKANGDDVAWYLNGKSVSCEQLHVDETCLTSVQAVKDYNPIAVFVPGNVVPDFFPGIKVQVFHGLEYKKKGHFVIRDFFDLYCTHGPITTKPFIELMHKHKHFSVVETGWPKLDPYFNFTKNDTDKPVILYAPTFSPNLSSAPALVNEIAALANTGNYKIQIKFHPKMQADWISLYKDLTNNNIEICQTDNIIPIIQQANVVISDTSSVVDEALIMGKTVVTFNNSAPQSCLFNFTEPSELANNVEQALNPSNDNWQAIEDYVAQVHPYQDGQSSQRILEAVDGVIQSGVKRKPINFFRKIKIRQKMQYYRFS